MIGSGALRIPNKPRNNNDSVVSWAISHSRNGLIRPNLVLRYATDSNWVFHHKTNSTTATMDCYSNNGHDCAALMNIVTPGQRVNGVLTWSVQENVDNVADSATFEAVNALSISQISSTMADGGGTGRTLPWRHHSSTVLNHYVRHPSTGEAVALDGAHPLSYYIYQDGRGHTYHYAEDRLLFRVFDYEYITLADASAFPDPRVPDDEDDSDINGAHGTSWPSSSTGIGAYYVLIDDEVIRVISKSGNILIIPPGGRGCNGKLQAHTAGATVTLLGYGEPTGRWAAMSYLSGSDSHPYRSPVRPGTCLAAYEGYGDFDNGLLTKQVWNPSVNNSYEFTGFWFTKGHEASLADDGVPKMNVDLVSSGWILQHQKITQDVIFRLANDQKNYAIQAETGAGIARNITGDWVDFHAWDPHKIGSYPLQIKTEFAQHKAFFDHMGDSTFGKDCEQCQEEWRAYTHRGSYKIGDNPIGEARAVGKHIYKESIRVFNGGHGEFEAGPLKTYGALMVRLAKLAWEIPNDGNPLGKYFSKIPDYLWQRMEQFEQTGLCWNGQLAFRFKGETSDFQWDKQEYVDQVAFADKIPLECPFEASYDKQDWFQPILDMAEMNGMTFRFSRRGRPIFIPKGLSLRGQEWTFDSLIGTPPTGEWFMGLDGSISSYTHNFDVDQALTSVWVSGTTAFDSEFSITAAGTGLDTNDNLIWYSSKVGNKEALMLTGGAQQIDTISLDNISLGLSWYTKPAGYGLQLVRGADREGKGGQTVEVSKLPPIPQHELRDSWDINKNPVESAKNFQKLYNFLRVRFYINAARKPGTSDQWLEKLKVDGFYGADEAACCRVIRTFLINTISDYTSTAVTTTGHNKTSIINALNANTSGIWDRSLANGIKVWSQLNSEYIKTDVWWYALGGYDWDYYVAAITGLPIPQVNDSSTGSTKKDSENDGQDPEWSIDQLALRNNIQKWMNKFLKQAIAVGNRTINDSLNKSIVRTVNSNLADPRIHVGDVVYISIPGYQAFNDDYNPKVQRPSNATYITAVTRTMDFQNMSYSATYSGYKYNPYWDQGIAKRLDTYF